MAIFKSPAIVLVTFWGMCLKRPQVELYESKEASLPKPLRPA